MLEVLVGSAQQSDSQTLAAVLSNSALVGAAVTLIGTVITVAATWATDRNLDAKRAQVLDEGTKYIQFWDQYYKCLQTTSGKPNDEALRSGLLTHLEKASTFVTHRMEELQRTNYRPPEQKCRQRFLLYLPARPVAWIPRVIFYSLYVYAVLLLVGLPATGVLFPFVAGFQSRFVGFAIGLLFGLICALALCLVALPFRSVSLWLERRMITRAVL